ncbi:hypothetical protein C0Q70_16244 [Pomacea canaliculata]|uniref:Non-haem dioxygenase N-terminal domain-containing protein n=1 Tax=Pomacea canaliculata TaxID=400727 RepID=A0A2T7NP88_POMCA|nr:hypothetical protein C0Q70_16244 [Pomacea canaliculata]
MAASNIDLPVIDLKKAQDPAKRLDVARKLVHALETVGFLYIDNAKDLDSQKLMTNTRWFFSLPDEEKQQLSRRQWNPFSRNRYRGYFPLQEGEISYKEGFEIGQEIPPDDDTIHPFFNEPNVWPAGLEGSRAFHSDMVEYYYAATHCGAEILRLVSLGCDLGEEWFEDMFFPNSLSTLRLLHYPARYGDVPDEAVDDGTVLCCSEHSDSGKNYITTAYHHVTTYYSLGENNDDDEEEEEEESSMITMR